ncbi:MAG TPA: thioesterase family protein [Thermoanaerobaculia bacterium]|jgi:acyl-CoA thioesterase FadM
MPPPAAAYAKPFRAGWGTMDFNGHMANTAHLDLAADLRMAFFSERGFPPAEFRRRRRAATRSAGWPSGSSRW